MADTMDPKNIPGSEAAMNSMSTTARSLQSFASEVQRMSKDSMTQTTEMMEKLRGAKSMEDLVSIQTNYMQQSFSHYADYTRRLSEMMMAMPMEFAKQGRGAFQQGADAMTRTGERVGEQMQKAGDKLQGNS